MKAVIANMGFILQMAGLFVTIPIAMSFVFSETSSTIALFLTATCFFVLGFMLNSLCERKDLGYRESSALFLLSFIFLSLIGSIPYMYTGVFSGDSTKKITDSLFESVSGFTTTGFSVIPDPSALPRSILLYRSLTQFIGGIGIVLLLLAFLYPEEKLVNFSKSMGFSENHKIKRTFLVIIAVYLAYISMMTIATFFLGYTDIMSTISFVFATISTGGFAPVADISPIVSGTPFGYILMFGMILGALNFIALAGVFRLRIREFIFSEIPFFLALMAISVYAVSSYFGIGLFDSAFHTISLMTTTGFGYLSLADFDSNLVILMTALMLVGGTSFSTAGGIKIYRVILFFKAIKKAVIELVTKKPSSLRIFGKEYQNSDIIQNLMVIALFVSISMISGMVISSNGYSFPNSLFESASALSNTGISSGIAVAGMPFNIEALLIILMLLGRVEIIAILIIFSKDSK